ncbi:NAD(P)/FAD-dependent oxidoreductase [Saccharomonospora viridis]|jgi:NADH dehydrogenase|uniref:NADH dehydrogenase, FAD-containing subunit n=2 Tax=Saccharomonospora viridis TaxID=1852 RepID=C7MYV1_SACVD|nr:NAD(P)/FAD-dependent oxidoreductase [Saccharomonospora viridis]ACU98190.1 NADH dehydrogenase, FAD-containing subunit [Saccharomonospora viridis DSM 43017]KHF42300.1 NADH dehydrogenase [Saccharomonospora viridis]SFP94314.1 NADH dehydrogenase [Saccharomonospora viridis]
MAVKSEPTRILILGGGYVGLYTALGLQKRLRANEASVTVVDPQPHMTYQPFLPEAAAGSIEPRHVVVPLRRVLRRCHVLTARVTAIEHANKTVTVEAPDGHIEQLNYDVLVVALGSVARLLPIPGLAEQGIAIKTIGEAIYLRNHVLSKLDEAASTLDPELRRRMLTFTVVGGGFAGIEALAELEDMTRYACRYYDNIKPEDIRWVLVEAAGRILPEVRETLGVWTAEQLEKRGIEVYLSTAAKSFENGHVVLSDGTEFDSDTIIWTAGVKANPVVAESDLPTDKRGRLKATATLQVVGHPDVWTAGDVAAVPDLSRTEEDPTATCPPNAQHAVRQARHLAKNIIRSLRGGTPTDYYHKNLGAVAGLGLHKGVADALNLKIKGYPAWLFHRAYHVKAMPTFNRKVRILLDWLLSGLFRRETVSLGQINNPKEEFARAAKS